MPRPARLLPRLALWGAVTIFLALFAAGPAFAHGFSSVVYADISSDEPGHVAVELQLEYDLLVVSAADAEQDDPLFRQGTDAFDYGEAADRVQALVDHESTVIAYVTARFVIERGATACTATRSADYTMTEQQGVPYAVLPLDYSCGGEGSSHEITSTLFGDEEGYVTGTTTILSYELDGRTGSAALGPQQQSFSTAQSTGERFWEFFHLGAEHLLGGLDHVLFLLALIAGSRRLREVVLAATAFTLAHSVTFILAATGLVTVPDWLVEPVIALSISVVAGWYLWLLWRRRDAADELSAASGMFGIDRAGWLRLAVVFLFGLVHGLGFAGALGIDEPWSWTLLWSLLVFNLGIEVVQLLIIAVLFPLLALLRHRMPQAGLWVTGAVAAGVCVMGLIWFVQRIVELA